METSDKRRITKDIAEIKKQCYVFLHFFKIYKLYMFQILEPQAVGHYTGKNVDNSLEQLRNEGINFIYLANFEHLLQFCQEQRFFDAVGKRPELEQAFQKRNSQSSIFSQEQHRAPQ